MNCEQTQSLLLAYLDGESAPSERALILAHLTGCTVCQQELDLLSTARNRVRVTLQRHADQAVPKREAWRRLEARLTKMTEAAQPPSSQHEARGSRWISSVHRTAQSLFSGDITMGKRSILATGMAVLAIATVAVLIFNNVVPVSAQTILKRATAAQAAQSAAQGIQHTRIEIYENPQAGEGKQAGTTVIDEAYYDPATGYYHFISHDPTGKILEVGAVDGSYDYTALTEDIHNGSIIIHRTPLNPDDVRKKAAVSGDTTSVESLFDHFRRNPHVEVAGRETRAGRQVYVLVNRNFQASKLPNGQDQKDFTGTMTMVFDAKTYQLVESETTVYKDGKEIVIERVRFLVDEVLQPGTPVDWSLSDLQNVTFVDDQPQEVDDVSFETISAEQLAAHINLYSQAYVLKSVPVGCTQEIVAMSNQPSDEPYRYEIHYRNASSGAAFNLQAVGVMDPGFIETAFYDGSYKAANGLVLNYSSSHPEGSENGTAGMLTVPGGTSFLVDSTLSRTEVQALIEDLAPLK